MRKKAKPTAHDRRVKREVTRLRRGGWKVKADLPGHERPAPIGKKNRIPDIEATKPGTRRLIEVETPESLVSDSEQQSTFRRSAAQRNRTTFDVIVTDED